MFPRMLLALLSLAILIGNSIGQETCTEMLGSQDFTVESNYNSRGTTFTFDKFVGDKILCRIEKYEGPRWGNSYCGYTVVRHGSTSCNGTHCDRFVEFIRDGISCKPFIWGPDEGPSNDARYKVGAWYKPATQGTLTIEVVGSGNVAIDGIPGTSRTITHGKPVTVSATDQPGTGYTFKRWELKLPIGSPVTLSTSPTYSFIMPESGNLILRAVFQLSTFYLTIDHGSNGTTNPVKGTKLPATYGSQVAPKPFATANTNFTFYGWFVSGNGNMVSHWTNPELTVTLTGDATATALFLNNVVALNFQSDANGTTNPPPGVREIPVNEEVPIIAIPNPGWVIDHWETCPSNQVIVANPTAVATTVKVTHVSASCGETTPYVKAIFKREKYRLNILVSGLGSTNPSPGADIDGGVGFPISAINSSAGHRFKEWRYVSGPAEIANRNSQATTVTITGPATIEAVFHQEYLIYLWAEGSGSFQETSPLRKLVDETFEVHAIPSPGWMFQGWKNSAGLVQIDLPQNPATSGRLLEPRDAELTAVFTPLAHLVTGRITNGFNNEGIPGATVRFVDGNSKEYVALTGPDGTFNVGTLFSGPYFVAVSSPCFATISEPITISGPLHYERSLQRGISIHASKRKVQVNEATELSLGACPDIVDQVWTTDMAGVEQTDRLDRNISVSFANPGFKTVRAVVKFANGQQLERIETDYIEVVPCLPGRPTVKITPDTRTAGGKIVDRCEDGFGLEDATFTADLILGRCASGDITTYQWSLNGIPAGSGPAVTLDISTNPEIQKVKVTATRDGKSYADEVSVNLQECGLSGKGEVIMNTKDILLYTKTFSTGGSPVLEPVPGVDIRDDDGNVMVAADAIFGPACGACKHRVTFVKWILRWKNDKNEPLFRDIAEETADILLDQGFRDYTLTAVATVEDIQPGRERPLGTVTHTRPIRVLPKIPLPILGSCNNAPFYCQTFYSDKLKSISLDPKKPTLELESVGAGFSGFRDDGSYASLGLDGDFTFKVRIKSLPGGEAGVQLRNSLLVSDRSLFLGRRQAGNALFIRRGRFSEDAIPYDFSSAATCLRIARDDAGLTLHMAPASGSSCPDPEIPDGWGTALEQSHGFDLSGWTGRLQLGLAAGGGAGTVEFDGIFLKVKDTLSEPALMVNTVFRDGNLVKNWSFENEARAFTSSGGPLIRTEETQESEAYMGRYFGRIQGKPSGQEIRTTDKLLLRVKNGGQTAKALRIKFRVRQSGGLGLHPALGLIHRDGTVAEPMQLDVIATEDFENWFEYSQVVNLADLPGFEDSEYFHLHLVHPAHFIAENSYLDVDEILVSPVFQDIQSQDRPVTSLTFADGMTQEFQTARVGESEVIISARLLDEEGRAARTLPIFGELQALDSREFRKVRRDPVLAAQAYFNDNATDPKRRIGDMVIDIKPRWSDFREDAGRTVIENSPLNRTLQTYGRSGAGDQDFQFIYEGSSDGTQGVKTTFLGSTEQARSSRELSNAYGYVVATESKAPLAEGGETLTSLMDKDVLGRVWTSTTPGQKVRTNAYNTLDQPIASGNPDAGNTRTLYDNRGLMRFFMDSEREARNEFVANVYDRLGRLTHVYIVHDAGDFTQSLADNLGYPIGNPKATLQISTEYDKRPFNLPPGIGPNEMTFLKGQPAASIATTARGQVGSYFSYDEQGQVKTVWKQILDLPLQRTDFMYNLAGLVVKKTVSGSRPDGSVYSKTELLEYDAFNRLKIIRNGSPGAAAKEVARFEYWPDGKTRYIDFGAGLKQGISYRYDESERVIAMQHEVLDERSENPGLLLYYPSGVYEQRLKYDGYGNLASQNYRLGNAANPFRGVKYAYDPHNRLADVDHGKSGVSYDAIDYHAAFEYNSNYMYDEDGRIIRAARGKNDVSSDQDYAVYEPYDGTNRVKRIVGTISPNGHDRSDPENYQYDGNGNLILDKATKRAFTYDFRNLPIRVSQCLTISGNGCGDIAAIHEMVYDAEGHRVAKFKVR